LVKLELFTLKDVAIATAGLSWARRNTGKESARVELISKLWVNNSTFGVLLDVGLNVS